MGCRPINDWLAAHGVEAMNSRTVILLVGSAGTIPSILEATETIRQAEVILVAQASARGATEGRPVPSDAATGVSMEASGRRVPGPSFATALLLPSPTSLGFVAGMVRSGEFTVKRFQGLRVDTFDGDAVFLVAPNESLDDVPDLSGDDDNEEIPGTHAEPPASSPIEVVLSGKLPFEWEAEGSLVSWADFAYRGEFLDEVGVELLRSASSSDDEALGLVPQGSGYLG